MTKSADTLLKAQKFEGFVTETPFNSRKVRNKEWYTIWSLRALSMLQFLKRGHQITLDFPDKNLEDIIPALELLSRLPYLLDKKFESTSKINARTYDQAAKEMLSEKGDI